MFDAFDGFPWQRQGNLAATMRNVAGMPDDTVGQYRAKEQAYKETLESSSYESNCLLADAWCAAFVWRKKEQNHPEGFLEPITQATFKAIAENPNKVPVSTRDEIRRLARQYRFFHWHLAFPDVFPLPEQVPDDPRGWSGGFNVVLGNPPWERIKIQEQEWFAQRRPDITKAPNAAARRKMIQLLATEDSGLHQAFLNDRRVADGESCFVRRTARFPLCGRGDINTFAVFAELDRQLISPEGWLGCIVPSGIATSDTTKHFFKDLITTRTLRSLYSFAEIRDFFTDTDSRDPFCLLTISGLHRPSDNYSDFVFLALKIEELQDERQPLYALRARHRSIEPKHLYLPDLPNAVGCRTD